MMDDLLPPDQVEGAPHPRDTAGAIGHDAAKGEFLTAYNSGRLHHAWMITGPRGVGKATLAYEIARFLLTQPKNDGGMFAPAPPQALTADPHHPAIARISAGSDPSLFTLSRGYDEKRKAFAAQINIEALRKLSHFFALSNPDGGRRVVIIDALDDMNVHAANALLKLLEEPPADAILLLVTHQPTRVLPTIRSRCRVLRLHPLAGETLETAAKSVSPDLNMQPGIALLADGSVGRAIELGRHGGLGIYEGIVSLFSTAPNFPREKIFQLLEPLMAKSAEAQLRLFLELLDIALARIAKTPYAAGAVDQIIMGERDLFAKLCPTPQAAKDWAEARHAILDKARQGLAVNLDAMALCLDMIFEIEKIAARHLR